MFLLSDASIGELGFLKPVALCVLVSAPRVLEETPALIKEIGLDDIKSAVCKPAPTVFGVAGDGYVVVMTGGQNLVVIIDYRVYPNELSVLVHTLDKSTVNSRCICAAAAFRVKSDLIKPRLHAS